MKVPADLPSSLATWPFSTADAARLGVQRQRTRARDLISPTNGIRLPVGVAEDVKSRAHAYAIATPNAVVSHMTAAVLWGLPLPLDTEEDEVIHLSFGDGSRGCRRRGAQNHRVQLRPGDTVQGRLFTATSPERTWVDLASLLSLDELIIAGDYLVRRRNPLSTMGALRNQVGQMPDRKGIVSAREALGWIRPRTDSAKETELRLLLVRAGLPEPSINVAIVDELDQWVQDPDMSYQDLRIAMQYDGGHHITEMQRRSDILRDDRALELDWVVLKYSQLDLNPLGNGEPSAVTKTRRALLDRVWAQNPAA